MNRMVLLFKGIVLAIIMATMMTLPAHANDDPAPTPDDDVISIYPGGFKLIDQILLEGDTHPAGKDFWVCAAEPVDKELYFGSIETYISDTDPSANAVFLNVYSDVTVETVAIRYAVCDGVHMAWANAEIDIVYPQSPTVKKTKRPGRLKFTNPNDEDLFCGYGSKRSPEADGWIDVPAHGSTIASVHRTKIFWMCFIGPEYGLAGQGTVRNIELPKRNVQVAPRATSDTQFDRLWRTHVN